MLFNSLAFAIFLPVVFIIYWLIPARFRWAVLLVSGYYFYMSWNASYVVLIAGTTLISYLCALGIDKASTKGLKKLCVAAALIICLAVLFFFKYFNFAASGVCAFLSLFAIKLHPVTLSLLLPVGISFYTFQTLGYVIDVYRGDKPCRHIGKYAAFISFFPQLVAGPIERSSKLLPQIDRPREFSFDKASAGMKIMAWGFFKKIVVADTLAVYVDRVFDNSSAYSGRSLILAVLFFTVQIYCDFSGYSDIAIGSAKLFGIDLMKNFNSPYFSLSVKDFWRRWHISLSTWFKDYLYIPLGGNRKGTFRSYLNTFITFLVSGLWHGASLTFVIWGCIHGIARMVEEAVKSLFKKASKAVPSGGLISVIRIIIVFLFVAFAWIFFRASSIGDAFSIIGRLFTPGGAPLGLEALEAVKVVLMIALLGAFDFAGRKTDVIEKISSLKTPVRWLIYIGFIVFTVLLLPVKSGGEFIYFAF